MKERRFAPRFGFAYDVFGNGTTSVHGGWGLFNNKIGDLLYVNAIRTNPPQFAGPSISIYNQGTTLANFSMVDTVPGVSGPASPLLHHYLLVRHVRISRSMQ